MNSMFSTGQISLMRVLTFFVVGNIMIVWTIECIKISKIADIPSGVVAIFIAMVGGKALQRFGENGDKNEK